MFLLEYVQVRELFGERADSPVDVSCGAPNRCFALRRTISSHMRAGCAGYVGPDRGSRELAMTVVFSMRCEDGLVVAADSQITEGSSNVSFPAQKLHPLGDHAAWGGSGARAVLHDLEKVFTDDAAVIIGSEDVGRALQERVIPVLRHHYDHFIEDVPGATKGSTPSAYVLAAGYADDTPFIIEINPNGMVSRYEDVGFHAVGSGAAMAQQAGALLAHFRMTALPVDYGVVAAVRVLDALSRTSPSVGGPIDVCRIDPDGAHHLSEKEIDEGRRQVRRWTDLERRALDELFA
jgi:proteasome beta subunit